MSKNNDAFVDETLRRPAKKSLLRAAVVRQMICSIRDCGVILDIDREAVLIDCTAVGGGMVCVCVKHADEVIERLKKRLRESPKVGPEKADEFFAMYVEVTDCRDLRDVEALR